MEIGRRELLTGVAASAIAFVVPPFAIEAFDNAPDPFRFALPRKMNQLGYLFHDPWRVDFDGGSPYRVIHETTGAVFPTAHFAALEDEGMVVINRIRRDYAPVYALTARFFEGDASTPILRDVPAPAFNTVMQEGDLEDLAEISRAACIVSLHCHRDAPPRDKNGAVLVRPSMTPHKSGYYLSYEEIPV